MFRRIELINNMKRKDGTTFSFKTGLCGLATDIVTDAWGGLHVPRKPINKNVRFYFTELGWKKFGRPTIDACIQSGQDYRIMAVEEHDMDIYYRDEYQVCLLPKRKSS